MPSSRIAERRIDDPFINYRGVLSFFAILLLLFGLVLGTPGKHGAPPIWPPAVKLLIPAGLMWLALGLSLFHPAAKTARSWEAWRAWSFVLIGVSAPTYALYRLGHGAGWTVPSALMGIAIGAVWVVSPTDHAWVPASVVRVFGICFVGWCVYVLGWAFGLYEMTDPY